MARNDVKRYAAMLDGKVYLLFESKEFACRFVRKMRVKGYDVHFQEMKKND